MPHWRSPGGEISRPIEGPSYHTRPTTFGGIVILSEQRIGSRGVSGYPRDRTRPVPCEFQVAGHRSIDRLGLNAAATLFFKQFDCASHNLLLIPVNTFKGSRDPTLCVEDVDFDAVPVH